MPHPDLKLLVSGESSDFTIICQGVEFKVHKAIISEESSFFRAACTGDFKECHEATISLPEEDPEILARVLHLLYSGDVDNSPSTTKEIEKTLANLVPGGPTTERSKFETRVLVYFCADRRGIESRKRNLAVNASSLISEFEVEDMDDGFTAFVEEMYNDIPAKDDPLRAGVTVETLKRLYRLGLLPYWHRDDSYDDSYNDSYDDSIGDGPKRIAALIRANEPSALMIASDILHGWARKYDL